MHGEQTQFIIRVCMQYKQYKPLHGPSQASKWKQTCTRQGQVHEFGFLNFVFCLWTLDFLVAQVLGLLIGTLTLDSGLSTSDYIAHPASNVCSLWLSCKLSVKLPLKPNPKNLETAQVLRVLWDSGSSTSSSRSSSSKCYAHFGFLSNSLSSFLTNYLSKSLFQVLSFKISLSSSLFKLSLKF